MIRPPLTLQFKVAAPPAANLRDTLTSLALITPVAGDETPRDDTAVVKQVVIGSFDPNDKAESQGGAVDASFIAEGKYLHYVVRFQNLGTDTAFRVVVRDTLDAGLDESTLQVVGTSHPGYRLNIVKGRFLSWEFDDIRLPHKGANEPRSHGFVAFRVRPRSTVAVGDTLHNTASIYFDYNLPVVTNDAYTVVTKNSAVMPTLTISMSPAGISCAGTALTFSAVAAPNNLTGVQYQWTVNDASAGTNAAQFTTSSLKNGDVVRCVLTVTVGGNTVRVESNAITVVVTNTAAPTLTASGNTTFCTGGSVGLTANGSGTYQWFRDEVLISGASSTVYQATETGVYTAKVTANGCTSVASAGVEVRVNPLPPVPTITAAGNVLTSSSPAGNQWYLNSVAISGATTQSYTATASGAYTVQVTQEGCSATSAVHQFVATGIVSAGAWNGEVRTYPNPVSRELYVDNNRLRKLHLQLVDAAGRIVYEGRLAGERGHIDMQALPVGMYQLLLTDTRKKETLVVVVLKQ